MKKGSNLKIFILAGLLLLICLVVAGAAASVFAYRQFNRDDEQRFSFSVGSNRQIDDKSPSTPGVTIGSVDPEGPAAAAGLTEGNVIVEVNGKAVNTPADLKQAINRYQAGDTITLLVQNEDKTEEIDVTLASAGPYLGVNVAGGPATFGFEFGEPGQFDQPFLEPDTIPHPMPFSNGAPGDPSENPDDFFHGPLKMPVFVLAVVPGSPAETTGIAAGDMILEVDGQAVESRQQVIDIIGQKAPGDQLELTIHHGGGTEHLAITLTSHPDDDQRAFLGVQLGPDSRSQFERFFEQRNG